MCIWCQLFSRAVSKTANLYSHHNVSLIGTFCYFYKAELGITVELNLVITCSVFAYLLSAFLNVCSPKCLTSAPSCTAFHQ